MNRRELLAGTVAGALWPALGRASPVGDRKLIVLFALGGWDTTRVLSPVFDAAVDLEPEAEPWSVGGLTLVDHPSRPSVRSFFNLHARRVALVEGLLVASVAHAACQEIVLTGGTRGDPDWGALAGAEAAGRYTLPQLVLDGPTFPAHLAGAVARVGAGGQLDGLMTGRLAEGADQGPGLPHPAVEGAVDRYLLRRAAALDGRGSALQQAWVDARRRALALKDLRYTLDLSSTGSLNDRLDLAVEALAGGLSRVVSMTTGLGNWDTHVGNDPAQAVLWEDLFAGLLHLVDRLDHTVGPSGEVLAEDTVVLVVSEMNRTPLLNADLGKDHWPWTSALLFGGPVAGGLRVGGYTSAFEGIFVDPATGRAGGSATLTAGHLGATVLRLLGLDDAELLPGFSPILPLIRRP